MRVDDYADVQVLLDNQAIGRTDSDGWAVIPRLRAYDRNRVSIDARDLPLDATVDALAIDAVPWYRSGLLFDFPVRRSHGAQMRITLDDGGDMPAGAYVEVNARAERFPVALYGAAYVTGLTGHDRLQVTWRGQRCVFDVTLPANPDPLPISARFPAMGCRGEHSGASARRHAAFARRRPAVRVSCNGGRPRAGAARGCRRRDLLGRRPRGGLRQLRRLQCIGRDDDDDDKRRLHAGAGRRRREHHRRVCAGPVGRRRQRVCASPDEKRQRQPRLQPVRRQCQYAGVG